MYFELIFHSLSIHFPCPFWVRAGWRAWLCYYFLFIFACPFLRSELANLLLLSIYFSCFFWLRAGWWVWPCYYFLFIFLVFFPLRAGWWVWLSHYFLFISPFLFAARGWLPGAALLLLSIHFPCSSDSGSVCIFFIFHHFFLISIISDNSCTFWCSFCAGLWCFFERNLAISGARFALVSCAFLNETWRFLVLVLCWSLVLF